MKKTHQKILIGIVMYSLCSCNQGEEKKSEEAKTDSVKTTVSAYNAAFAGNCTGTGNYIIEETVAKNMITHYAEIFKKKGKPDEIKYLGESEWVDAVVIRDIANFAEKASNNIDGIRIIQAAKSNTESSTVILVPTRKNDSSGLHDNVWGDIIPNGPEQFTFVNFSKTYRQANPWKENFQLYYRDPLKNPSKIIDSLSASVWIDECIFMSLRELIANDANQIDGVRIYFAAYKEFMPKLPSQKYANQSTVVLVPTTSDGNGGHTDDWNIIKTTFSSLTGSIKSTKDAGYNHGELCPKVCPPAGN